MKEFQDKLVAIEASLNRMDLPHSPANLYEPIHYFLSLGGKRIRPLFTILCAELYGIPIKESMPGALSLELFHNFTLIHDDIMDKAPVRRGLATVHEKWNTNIAILSGDVLMMQSFRLLEHYDANKYKRLLTLLQKTAVEVCEGQQLDMDFEGENEVLEKDYIEMIRLKTSVLLGCSCAFGGIIGDASEEDIQALYGFGEQLGIAFQIQDDLLDAFGDSSKVGKQSGGDILCDKKTILFTTFQSKANTQEKLQFEEFRRLEGLEKIEQIKGLYLNTGVHAYCLDKQRFHLKNALDFLEKLSVSYSKESLLKIADYMIQRVH